MNAQNSGILKYHGISVRILRSLLVFMCLSFTSFFFLADSHAEIREVYIIKIEDETINPVTADYIIDAIDKAYQDKAECLILELDTPGGLLSSTRLIVKKIISAKVPVVVYIYPSGSRAGSAGVFITYASHIAAMAPSTNIGAAHPVKMGGGERSIWDALRDLVDSFSRKETAEEEERERRIEEKEDILGDKVLRDTVAFIRALATEKGRNVEWAEKSVTESASVTEDEALKNNIIEIIARDEKDLLSQLNGRKVRIGDETRTLNTKNVMVKRINMDFRQRFLSVLANPNIAYILLILGFYGLLYEITHPGIGFPGIAGAICIILAFFSMQVLPTNYAGLALIILAMILFIAEAMVPGFGLLTLGGLICMVLGSLLLFEAPSEIMRVSLILIVSLTLATAGITIVLVRAVVVSRRHKVVSGVEGLIEAAGHAETDIAPGGEGKVFIHGEIWNAVSKEKIEKGSEVRVVKVEGMLLEVKKT